MQIKEKIALLPTFAGVYQFLDAGGDVIYVGKAKSLRSRVASYFTDSKEHSAKVRALVRNIADLRHIIVDTEQDALLLENNLIKEYQPRYNIMLKDSKTYPWICISKEPFARIFSTRIFNKSLGEYFGPYASVMVQRAVLEIIRSLYPLRSCRHNMAQEKIVSNKYSVCLDYHIGNCRGGCVSYETEQQYQQYIYGAKAILKGDFSLVREYLNAEMEQYSNQMKYEEAEKIRKKLELLENYKHRSIIVSPTITNVDVVNILIDEGATFVNRMRISNGSVVESRTTEVRSALDETPEELLTFTLAQMNNLSREIVVPFMPIEILDDKHTYNVAQRGDKAKLLKLSLKNCKLYQVEKLKYIEKTDPDRHEKRLMAKMQKDLDLDVEPRHIECFDNSNIQGSHAVAACVVFKNGRPSKREYRHYNIKTVVGANDYASMQEIVYRRYKRLLDEELGLPQLIVIDGGKGQLGAAISALEELGIQDKIKIVGLAKRLEELFFAGDPTPHYLDKRGETLKVLMLLRDEAHRFGIAFHRHKRSISFLRSELEDIGGLGKVSIEKMMKKYKTISRMSKVSELELDELIGKLRADKFRAWLSSRDTE